jgi:uncharacterized membrane protein YphA (DoxX/SURF4 family)
MYVGCGVALNKLTDMKKTTLAYWIVTVIFAAFMLMSGFPDLISMKDAVDIFAKLQLPAYLLPFLGAAKILGAIAILIPGFPRIKEWAYAGLIFDLTGAAYCNYGAGQPISGTIGMALPIAVGFVSYWLYHRRMAVAR